MTVGRARVPDCISGGMQLLREAQAKERERENEEPREKERRDGETQMERQREGEESDCSLPQAAAGLRHSTLGNEFRSTGLLTSASLAAASLVLLPLPL